MAEAFIAHQIAVYSPLILSPCSLFCSITETEVNMYTFKAEAQKSRYEFSVHFLLYGQDSGGLKLR